MGEHNGSINCQEMPWDRGKDAAHIERETENLVELCKWSQWDHAADQIGFINQWAAPQLGMLILSWRAIFLNKAESWSDISLTE